MCMRKHMFMFQPFLRFYEHAEFVADMVPPYAMFQPFLRFYLEREAVGYRACVSRVSTLLEILLGANVAVAVCEGDECMFQPFLRFYDQIE